MKLSKEKIIKKQRRARRVRVKVQGTENRPRLTVFRSNNHLYCQLINDENRKTICAASDKELGKTGKSVHVTIEQAKELGMLVAKKAQAKGIKKVVFDRGRYKYHGRLMSLAQGARDGGLEF
ncbi:MAG: 50S ribosomal protein L18 [bacterium]|nr:50S ribosomal protein L18 [bacterium]